MSRDTCPETITFKWSFILLKNNDGQMGRTCFIVTLSLLVGFIISCRTAHVDVDQSGLASQNSYFEDGLVGLLAGGAEIMRALKIDHKPGQHILNIVMTHSSRYDFEEVSVDSVLSDPQKEANKSQYGSERILTLKQATERLHYLSDKLRELGVDPHSDPDRWRGDRGKLYHTWTVGPLTLDRPSGLVGRPRVLSDSFLDFWRNYVFEINGGKKILREQLSQAVVSPRRSRIKYSSLVDLEELIEAYFHSGNTLESIIDQDILQEFNDYLDLSYRISSDFHPSSLYEEKKYRRSLNDFVIHDPVAFFESIGDFARENGWPAKVRLALHNLRDLRKGLGTASNSDLSKSREAAQVNMVLKRLSEDKGVAFERLALIEAELTARIIIDKSRFVLVELLDEEVEEEEAEEAFGPSSSYPRGLF